MGKVISTYEELYQTLLSLDSENRMYQKSNEIFCIRLDELYDVTVYNNRDGEVYLEFNLKGRQLTHYHPDYQEAYEDLKNVLSEPEKELECLNRNVEYSRKLTYKCTVAMLAAIVFTLVCYWLFG